MPGTPTSNGKLSRRERERQNRRREILEAAQAVFAEKGYTHATLDEIAQRAEFGKGTLYNYFEGGKEDILFAIFDEIYDEMRQLIQEAFSPERMAARPFRKGLHDLVISWMFMRPALTWLARRSAVEANPRLLGLPGDQGPGSGSPLVTAATAGGES